MEEKREGEKRNKRKGKRRRREAKQKGMDFYDFWYGYMTFVWIFGFLVWNSKVLYC